MREVQNDQLKFKPYPALPYPTASRFSSSLRKPAADTRRQRLSRSSTRASMESRSG